MIVRALIAIVLIAIASPSLAFGICNSRKAILAILEKDYGEKPVARGVANNGALVERTESKDGKTWTLIVTTPKGITCLLAAGDNWEGLATKIGERAEQ